MLIKVIGGIREYREGYREVSGISSRGLAVKVRNYCFKYDIVSRSARLYYTIVSLNVARSTSVY